MYTTAYESRLESRISFCRIQIRLSNRDSESQPPMFFIMTVSAGNVIPSKKIIFPLSVATGRPKNREQSFEINSFRIIYAQKSGTIFRNQFFSNNLWDVSTRWRQKAGILFSGGYDISSGNCHMQVFLKKNQPAP